MSYTLNKTGARLDQMGTRETAYAASNTTIPNTGWGSVASLTLPAGTWVFVGQVRWVKTTSSENYMYLLNISTSSSSQSIQLGYKQMMTGTGARVCDQVTSVIVLNQETTVYLLAQVVGSAAESVIASDTFLRAVCVG